MGQNQEEIKMLCAKYGIEPSKERGQNFLIDERFVKIVADAADLTADDRVVEVGPGFGTLTKELVKRVHKVVAVEVDKRMYEAATDILERYENVKLVQGDILKIQNSEFRIQNFESYKLVANLPYSITSVVLRKFTEYEPRPTLMVVMVQKEVAERVCAKPGAMSILSVAVQYYGKPEIVAFVPRDAFWPEPEVDSAILRIEVSGVRGQVSGVDEKRLFQVVRIGFSNRRKQLQNNLSAGLKRPRQAVVEALQKTELDPKVRAQELSVANWIALTRFL